MLLPPPAPLLLPPPPLLLTLLPPLLLLLLPLLSLLPQVVGLAHVLFHRSTWCATHYCYLEVRCAGQQHDVLSFSLIVCCRSCPLRPCKCNLHAAFATACKRVHRQQLVFGACIGRLLA
jgi:hypothetical protein